MAQYLAKSPPSGRKKSLLFPGAREGGKVYELGE